MTARDWTSINDFRKTEAKLKVSFDILATALCVELLSFMSPGHWHPQCWLLSYRQLLITRIGRVF
jgi:hypothetical protein